MRRTGFSFGLGQDSRLVAWVESLLLALALAGVLLILAGGGWGIWVGLGLLLLGLIVVWLVFPRRYRFRGDVLLIRVGPLRWTIPTAAIERVEPLRSASCHSAWTFDSLRITYRQNDRTAFALVAPRNRKRFFNRLTRSAPQAEIVNRPLRSDTEPTD